MAAYSFEYCGSSETIDAEALSTICFAPSMDMYRWGFAPFRWDSASGSAWTWPWLYSSRLYSSADMAGPSSPQPNSVLSKPSSPRPPISTASAPAFNSAMSQSDRA